MTTEYTIEGLIELIYDDVTQTMLDEVPDEWHDCSHCGDAYDTIVNGQLEDGTKFYICRSHGECVDRRFGRNSIRILTSKKLMADGFTPDEKRRMILADATGILYSLITQEMIDQTKKTA